YSTTHKSQELINNIHVNLWPQLPHKLFDHLHVDPIVNFSPLKVKPEDCLCHLQLEPKRLISRCPPRSLTGRSKSGLATILDTRTRFCFSFRWRSRARARKRCVQTAQA